MGYASGEVAWRDLAKVCHGLDMAGSLLCQMKRDKGDGQTTTHDVQDMVLIHLVQIGEFAKYLKRISD
jgi:hypothetical protein